MNTLNGLEINILNENGETTKALTDITIQCFASLDNRFIENDLDDLVNISYSDGEYTYYIKEVSPFDIATIPQILRVVYHDYLEQIKD